MIESPKLLERFYEEYKEVYPDISLREMKLICSSPFQMMKEVMIEGNLEDVRIQHMFVARVSQSRVIRHLSGLYQRREKGNITEKVFDKTYKMLITHISNNPTKFKKYEDRIREITGGEHISL